MTQPTVEAGAPGSRHLRVPVEWWFVTVFMAISLWLVFDPRFNWLSAEEVIYRKLATLFGAGFAASLSVAYLHILLRQVAAGARRACQAGALLGGVSVGLAALTLVK